MSQILSDAALSQLFTEARSQNSWSDRQVSEEQLRQVYDLMKFGPTASNTCPARFVWVRSPEGKAQLAALASEGNRAKILSAPVTVIIGFDLDFPDMMPILFPARGEALRAGLAALPQKAELAFRNGSLQGGYLILAARAAGLDTGPMSGFNNAAVDEAFFAGTNVKSNFICGLGYGGEVGIFPRNPRLSFEEAGRLA